MTGADLDALPPIPRDDDGPVFNEPWEAHAFALALTLHEQGLFTWTEWADALGAEIEAAQRAGDPDRGDTYYHHWLNVLEKLTTGKGVLDAAALSQRKRQWRQAYLRTPHGRPVELDAGLE